ncbi:small integral membrane protein 15 [Columba livia]|uniref:Small integral membrane protein 15 n=1 Tax=Columba livia TaxID=8932 RepID=A0A2I0M545_COLLI|nr:small integral membrane protein 15 [Columba livia]
MVLKFSPDSKKLMDCSYSLHCVKPPIHYVFWFSPNNHLNTPPVTKLFLPSETFYASKNSHKQGETKGPGGLACCVPVTHSRWLWGEYRRRMRVLVTVVLPTC